MKLHRLRFCPPSYRFGAAKIERSEDGYCRRAWWTVTIDGEFVGRAPSRDAAREIARRAQRG